MRRYNLLLLISVGCTMFLLLFLGGRQYIKVNQGPKHVVQEQLFKQNEWVRTKTVDFKVIGLDRVTVNNEKRLTVKMKIKQLGPSNYANIPGNYSLDNAIWLNIPYGFSNMSTGMKRLNGQGYTDSEKKNPQEKVVVLHFTTRADEYKYRKAPARVSLLIQGKNKTYGRLQI